MLGGRARPIILFDDYFKVTDVTSESFTVSHLEPFLAKIFKQTLSEKKNQPFITLFG
jgi:hypothetical protein